jgi:hypothetical protein
VVKRRLIRMTRFFRWGLKFVVIGDDCGPRSFNCNHTKNQHNYGYTMAPVIYLCPRFFQMDRVSRARAIIHELTHRMVQVFASGGGRGLGLGLWVYFGHPYLSRVPGSRKTVHSDDQRADARTLARRRPLAARRSPVNWALLFQEIGTKTRLPP